MEVLKNEDKRAIAIIACLLSFKGDLSNYIDRKDFVSDIETNYLDFLNQIDEMDRDSDGSVDF